MGLSGDLDGMSLEYSSKSIVGTGVNILTEFSG